jgi:hypothetical protein
VFAFNEQKVRDALRIPADTARVVAITPVGIPEAWDPPTGRKPPSELLAFNGYE